MEIKDLKTAEFTAKGINTSRAASQTVVEGTKVKVKSDKTKSSSSDKKSVKQLMQATTFQARLGRRLDHISRRVIDNSIRLSGHATDMLRVEVKRNTRTHDPISYKLTENCVIPIMLPKMKDVPLRQLTREGTELKVPSLYTIDTSTYWEAYAPAICDLNLDDLLIRILWTDDADSAGVNTPYVFVTQVKEILGTFGESSLKWRKVWLTLADVPLPQEVIAWIISANNKREFLNY